MFRIKIWNKTTFCIQFVQVWKLLFGARSQGVPVNTLKPWLLWQKRHHSGPESMVCLWKGSPSSKVPTKVSSKLAVRHYISLFVALLLLQQVSIWWYARGHGNTNSKSVTTVRTCIYIIITEAQQCNTLKTTFLLFKRSLCMVHLAAHLSI